MMDLAMQATRPARLSPVITAWGENALHIANHCLGRVIIGELGPKNPSTAGGCHPYLPRVSFEILRI